VSRSGDDDDMQPERITELKAMIIELASLIEKMVRKSVAGLVERDGPTLESVWQNDEPRANTYEIAIDELCTHLIAQYQPMAKDLRTILMIYNINGSLERMGDHAVNIAQCGRDLLTRPQIKKYIDIPRMKDLVLHMLSDSISALIQEDCDLALDVCTRDDAIDGLRNQTTRELITYMTENPAIISPCLLIMRIAENLERIADLTTNISEDIVFMSRGKVIKHHLQDGGKQP